MSEDRPIDEYLEGVPDNIRQTLEDLRKTVQAAAPEATEGISYGVPAFRYRGKPLVGFAAFKRHCSFFPMGSNVLDKLEADVADFRTSKGTLQFTPEKPMPPDLVKKIVGARIEEIEAKAR